MASNSRAKSARTRAIDAFQLTVECGICTNVSQLRLLPCQHMMCAPCLGQLTLLDIILVQHLNKYNYTILWKFIGDC